MGTKVRIMLLLGVVTAGALATAVSFNGEVRAQSAPVGPNMTVIVTNPRHPPGAPPQSSVEGANVAADGTRSDALPSAASRGFPDHNGSAMLALAVIDVVAAVAFVSMPGLGRRR